MVFEGHRSVSHSVEIINRTEGDYRIVYGSHLFRQSADNYGDRLGGVFFERPPVGDGLESIVEHGLTPQEAEIFARAREERVPLYFGDIVMSNGFASALNASKAAEMGLGVYALLRGVKKPKSQSLLDRRAILRAALVGGGAYVTAGGVANAASILTPAGSPAAELESAIGDVAGPVATFILRLRNLVIAEKAICARVRHEQKLTGKELALAYGGAHKGLHNAFEMGSQGRVREIESILSLVPKSLGFTVQDFSLVARADFDKRGIPRITDMFEVESIREAALNAGFPDRPLKNKE